MGSLLSEGKHGIPSALTPTLGWLRVFLALTVIDFHYGFFSGHIAPLLENRLGPMAWLHDGIIAVFGFFVLSGYLIADMIERRYPLHGLADLGHFLLGRVARIYPLYWLVLGVLVIFSKNAQVHGWSIFENFLLFPFGLWSFFMDHKSFGSLFSHLILPPAWTLSLDLVFYPIGAVLVVGRRYLYLCFLICLAFVFVAFFLSPSGIGETQYSWWRVQFLTSVEPNLLAFLWGLVLRLKGQNLPRSSWIAIVAFLLLLYVNYLPFGLGYFSAYFLSIVAIGWLVHHLSGAGRGPHEGFLGNFTYSIYLIHIPVEGLTLSWGIHHFRHLEVLSLILDVFLAFLLAVAIEAPLERIRQAWLKHAFLSEGRMLHWNLVSATFCGVCLISMIWYYVHGS